MNSLLDSLKENKVLISDGAWGTYIHKCGLQPGESAELWNVTHREEIYSIAKSYVDAGADIILTNSFGGSPIKLEHYGLRDRAFELNEAAASISREAAGDKCFVLGSIGPTGVMILAGEYTEQELYDGFALQAQALKKGGADAICIETMSAIDEAVLAIRAVKESTDSEIICTFTFEKTMTNEFRTMMGVTPAKMAEAVKKAGASIIGTNCGNGITQMIQIVKEIRKADSGIPVLVHANAGKPKYVDGVTVFPETPEIMAAKVNELIEAGANIIGGCCGTTPDHIWALAKAVGKFRNEL